jgi:outer membrane protein assembly factor BamB
VPSCSTPATNRNSLYYDVSGAGAAPAISGDLAIIPVGSQVLFLDLVSDSILFNFDAGSAVRSAPVIAGDKVYFGNEAGTVFALDLATAEELWTWHTGGAVRSSVTVLDGIVLVTSTDTRLYAIGGS